MELIIEEISRGQKIIGSHKFATSQINIGRGYNNDIILADPYVCAEHLALKCEDNIWYVQDLESLNGSILGNKEPIGDWHALKSGDIMKIGKTQLRFYLPNHPVIESVQFSELESSVEYFGRWPMILSMIAIFCLINFSLLYINNASKEVIYSQLFIGVVTATLGYALWPLLCSLMGFLNKHEPRVGSQIGVSFALINLFWVIDFLENFFAFNLSSQWAWQWIFVVLSLMLTFSLFWFNFYIAFAQTKKRRIKIAAGLTLLIYGGLLLSDLSDKPEFNPYPIYDSTILTPMFSISPATATQDFIEQSNKLFNDADKQVEKNKQGH